jgi:DNA topoisomerase-1
MKSLIIVESFTKTKTIKKYINDDSYSVTFSGGHIYNLPKETLGFDTDTWKIEYIKTNPKIISNIREQVRKADIIYLAADPDLEGEAIAHNVKHAIKDLIKDKKCHRITFNEITPEAVKYAINNPRIIDMDTVNAQETRRIVDRLIGYKVSPILWSKFNKNYLSAGRVQIAGLIICINQRNLINSREINKYWKIDAKFLIDKTSKKNNIIGTLQQNNIDYKSYDINEVKGIINNLEIKSKWNSSYEIKTRNVFPQAPYTTTSMQQDSYNKYKFSAKHTMKIAQDLYENGMITYLRTDSTNISEDAKKKLLSYIKNTYTENYAKYRTYKTKVSNAQEAHEAIRITNPNLEMCKFEGCNSCHNKLYDMIRKRTLASLMSDAEYSDIVIQISNGTHIFKSVKSYMTFDGFNIVYNNKIESYNEFLKLFKPYCYLYEINSMGNIDDIPSMYNEVQLIKQLEKQGIGRPSTYATIIDKLIEKKYVELGQNPQQDYSLEILQKKDKEIIINNKIINLGGKQRDLLIPTDLGNDVIKYIYEIMPYLCDLKFTSNMENDLDDIINAKNSKNVILKSLYGKISASLSTLILEPVKKQVCEYKTGIISTRYGYCYYNKEKNSYTNIESYLKWKKIKAEQLNGNEISFLASLPKKVKYNDNDYYLNIGKFGLYLKDLNNKNIKLEKKLWNNYIA